MIDRAKLLKELTTNVLDVSTIKVDGQSRTLKLTLMPFHTPTGTDMMHLREMHAKPEYSDRVVAWDVFDKGWKTVLVDNVTYVQAVQD